MTLSKWGFLFWRTMAIGTGLGLLLGIVMKLTVQGFVFEGVPLGPYEWIFIVLGASVIAVVSHAGLFAYLVIRFLAMSMLRNKTLWDVLQIALIVITLFDLVYLRLADVDGTGATWLSYIWLPLILLAVSLIVAVRKVQETNPAAWVPTVFFMLVGTTLEAVPAIRLNQTWFILFTVTILVVCNAWQILMLHRLVGTPKS